MKMYNSKNRNQKKKFIALLTIWCFTTAFFTQNIFALDFYWVGLGENTNWNTPDNWNLTMPPTSNDNVYFDENSFPTDAKRTITISADAFCKNMTFKSNIPANRLPILTVNARLVIGDSLTFVPGMTTTANNNGVIALISSEGNKVLTTCAVTIYPNIEISGNAHWTTDGRLKLYRNTNNRGVLTYSGGGSLTVADSLTANGVKFTGSGDLHLVGHALIGYSSSPGFVSSGAGNSGNLQADGNITVANGPFTFSGSGALDVFGTLTTNSGAGTLSGAGAKRMHQDASFSGTLSIAGGDSVVIAGSLNVDTSGGSVGTVNAGAKLKVYGSLTGQWRCAVSGTGTKMDIKGPTINMGGLAITGGEVDFNYNNVTIATTTTSTSGTPLPRIFSYTGGTVSNIAGTTFDVGASWTYNTGDSLTQATAPALIRVGTGSFTTKKSDDYNNVEFYGDGTHALKVGVYNRVSVLKGSGVFSVSTAPIAGRDSIFTTDSLIIHAQAKHTFNRNTKVNRYLEIQPDSCGGMIELVGGIANPDSSRITMGSTSVVVVNNTIMTNLPITTIGSPNLHYTANNSLSSIGNVNWDFTENGQTLYWVGGSGNWSESNHWSHGSGQSSCGCIPTLLDDVVFDGLSGLTGTQTVATDIIAYCNNMTWHSSITGTPDFKIPQSYPLYIGGSLVLSSGMTMNPPGSNIQPTSIYFVSQRSNETILTNGVLFRGNVYFDSRKNANDTVTGGWKFLDSFTMADIAPQTYLYFNQGDLNFNGQKVATVNFTSTGNGKRKLNIANSIIRIGNLWRYDGTNLTYLTYSASVNSTIEVYGSGLNTTTNFAGGPTKNTQNVYYNVELKASRSGGATASNGTFKKLTLSGAMSHTFGNIVTDTLLMHGSHGVTYTLNDTLTVNKFLSTPMDCGAYSIFTSSPARTITMDTTAVVAVKNLDIRNISITNRAPGIGGMPTTGYPVENALLSGTATGWNVIARPRDTYYWVGGTGNWNQEVHWSKTSGGPGGAICGTPLSYDQVIFDDKSFTEPGQTVTIGSGECDSMTWVSADGTLSGYAPELAITNKLDIYGSLRLETGMKNINMYTANSAVNFLSHRANESLTTNGVEFNGNSHKIVFNVTGSWEIPNGISRIYEITFGGSGAAEWIFGGPLIGTTSNEGDVKFNYGRLDLSGQPVTIGTFTGTGAGCSLNIENSIISLFRSSNSDITVWNYTRTLESAVGSIISISEDNNTGTRTFIGASGQTYNDIDFQKRETTKTTPGIINANGAHFHNVHFGETGTINGGGGTFNNVTFDEIGTITKSTANIVNFDSTGVANSSTFVRANFAQNGTLNAITTDTLVFSNRHPYVYSFTSDSTSTINKAWYCSGNNCVIPQIKSTNYLVKAKLRVRKAAANMAKNTLDRDTLFLDFIRVQNIIAEVGDDWAILRKGPHGPNDEDNPLGWGQLGLNENWILDDYTGSIGFNNFTMSTPQLALACDDYPYTLSSVYFLPNPESTFEWRKESRTGQLIGTDPTFTLNDPGTYYLKVDYPGQSETCSLSDSIKILSPSDSLIWTGLQSQDWNDWQNWKNADGESNVTTYPTPCVDVLIPATEECTYYPDLKLLSNSEGTDYETIRKNAACHHIWFEHGGEVARTDSLHYAEAYVQLTLQSNEWYMLSMPLKNIYAGDIYRSDPNPIQDGLKIEPMLFNVVNPETTKTTEYKWTGSFNNADKEFESGQGVAIWVDEIESAYNKHSEVTFQFPKSDPFYYYYYQDGTQNGASTSELNRTKKNRFIYEDGNNKPPADGLVTLATSPVSEGGKPILVGNPFMSHIRFADFYDLNQDYIENGYKLAIGVSSANGKVNNFSTYHHNGASYVQVIQPAEYLGYDVSDVPDLAYIPPMQSFIVTSKMADIPALKANIRQTLTQPGKKLRSATANATPCQLEITAGRNGQDMSKNLLIYRENASSEYLPEEDSYTLFSQNSQVPVIVYTRSTDGYALDINAIGDFERTVPLGIRTSKKGEIRLKFAGVERFADHARIFLHDTTAHKVIDLSTTNEYVFNKNEDDLYVENRLFFTFAAVDAITGINAPITVSTVSIRNLPGQSIQVVSNNGSLLKNIQIMDIQGRVLEAKEPQLSDYTFHAGSKGIYLIRVTTNEGSEVKKVVIK